MDLTIFQVDAFAEKAFQGNPAAVCVLEEFLPDMAMQAIAMEMALSETAFVVPEGENYRIRWFTPTKEVKLCGHATLASAHVLREHFHIETEVIRFQSLSGPLSVTPKENELELDFPARQGQAISLPEAIGDALGGSPVKAFAGEDLMIVYADAAEIGVLDPDFRALSKLPYRGIIATAPCQNDSFDFVCRFFAPASGIDEDPVTGSAYTMLAPYYSELLGKSDLMARQVSKRGGNVRISLKGERVGIAGSAITIMHATLYLPDLQP